MCDKHEIEGEDYELCDHCGEKEQCGHLYPVWFNQERKGYDYWCYECKAYDAYECHCCGELFPEESGSVAIYAGGQDEYHYICFDCFYAEYSHRKEKDFLFKFAKDLELGPMEKGYISHGLFEESMELRQLLSLWTAYCLKFNYVPDTLSYDQTFMDLYSLLNNKFPTLFVWRPDDMDEDEQSMFDNFDLFMGQHLA